MNPNRDLLEMYDWLHKNPEPAGKEIQTFTYILDQLRLFNPQYVEATTSDNQIARAVYVDFGPKEGPVIILTADVDALDIGHIGHFCGHDFHAATLLGVVKRTAVIANHLKIGVRFLFRSGEEKGFFRDIVRIPQLHQRKAIAVVGQHCYPKIPAGTFELVAGPVNAGVVLFEAIYKGIGGHSSRPPEVNALRQAIQAAENVNDLAGEDQNIQLGMIRGGEAPNAIPNQCQIRGTGRTFDPDIYEEMKEDIAKTLLAPAEGIAKEYLPEIDVQPIAGPLINDPRILDVLKQVGEEAGLRMTMGSRSPGSDDFPHAEKLVDHRRTQEYFGDVNQYGTGIFYIKTGVGRFPDSSKEPDLHTLEFTPDTKALPDAVELMYQFIQRVAT